MNVTMCGKDVESKSVAQGGGGSFKNRKPKEKMVVVNRGRANPLMDRKVVGAVFF